MVPEEDPVDVPHRPQETRGTDVPEVDLLVQSVDLDTPRCEDVF